MEVQNGRKYKTNYERAAAYFIATCAKRPEKKSWQEAYEFIINIYKTIGEKPDEIGCKSTNDVWFEVWEQQKERKNDVKSIRGSIDKVYTIIAEFYVLVDNSQVCSQGLRLINKELKPKRALSKIFDILNIKIKDEIILLSEDLAMGLKELADLSKKNVTAIIDEPKEDNNYILFSRCVYDINEKWLEIAFDNAMGASGQLVHLCKELDRRGYRRVVCKDGKRMSLDYIKLFSEKNEPVKMSWADKFHAGIELTYEDLKIEPYYLWLRTPKFKTILEQIDNMSTNVQQFFINNVKTCDECKYCVQTDKSGTRPLAAISINGSKKCPYFPSFSFNWRKIDKEHVEDMLEAIDTMEGILNNKAKIGIK